MINKIRHLSLIIYHYRCGASLVELLIAVAVAAVFLPALLTGLVASRNGKAQEAQRLQADALLKEAEEATRNVREKGWVAFAVNGTYHPATSSGSWTFVSGVETINGFSRQVVISNANRDTTGKIVSSGGSSDPSTKKVDISVSWSKPLVATVSSTLYMTRYLDNVSCTDTTQVDFNKGIITNTQTTNSSGGEVILGNNTKAKWCSPSLSAATIDLPDGPPVAVVATASATSTSIPNEVFVAIAPYATSSGKLAYVNVSANTDPPVPTLKGTFTLDSSKYSAPGLVPTGINLDNSFITNSVAYYTSGGGYLYALLATTKPDHEVIAIQLSHNGVDTFQDPVNHIYKYWTFFNTRRYQGDGTSTPNQDYSPYGWGASKVAVLGSRGYAISGGYLYAFDLSNIDSKSTSVGLDELGCRIELDGNDCNPATSKIRKYTAGNTGASWNAESAGQTGCVDGGAVQKYGDNDIFPISVGGSTYVYVAVGAGVDPEFEIANVSSVPTNNSSPKINANTCGTISSGNASWKRVSSLDFNSDTNTQETSNSVFGRSDGTRAYIASNGGVDGNHDGVPDADQFYVIDTTTKTAPKFLSGTPSTGAQSGYYNGDANNIQMFPRRSLTVLNGQRVVLVGQDGFANDSINPKDYQVLKLDNEATPTYCGGVDFDAGFNDLTSVTEADFDTFVYMVANTQEKQLKIIQGGPDGTYADQGTFESATCASAYSTAFNQSVASVTTPANTSVKMQVAVAPFSSGSCTNANFSYVGPDGTSGTYFTPQGASISATIPFGTFGPYQNPATCFRYKLFLSTTDYNTTPTVSDVTTNYSP